LLPIVAASSDELLTRTRAVQEWAGPRPDHLHELLERLVAIILEYAEATLAT